MGKAIVCQEAEVECMHGDMPDKIVSVTTNNQYVNDPDGAKKMIVTTMDIGQPFEKKTFGQCKLQPTIAGFKPCQPQIQEWQDFYEKVTLDDGGNPILEDSKAICPIAGAPCIRIKFHGQSAGMSDSAEEEADEEVQNQINPLASNDDEEEEQEAKHELMIIK